MLKIKIIIQIYYFRYVDASEGRLFLSYGNIVTLFLGQKPYTKSTGKFFKF